jgi:cystathionine beta-lyase
MALKQFFAEYLPKLEVVRLEGTYLVWVDIHALEFTADELTDELLHQAKVRVNSGTLYGHSAGLDYIRLNIACPRATLMEALKRMGQALSPYMEDNDELGCPM